MIFTKQELDFLKIFEKCAVRESFFQIKAIKEKVYFSQYSDIVKLVTVLENKTGQEFEFALKTSQFCSMLNVTREDEAISIDDGCVKFGNDSMYQFEIQEFSLLENPETYLQILGETKDTFQLKNLDFISSIKNFISPVEQFSTVALQNNHFVASNEIVLGVVNTENKVAHDNLFFPAIFSDIVSVISDTEVSVSLLQQDTASQFFGIKIQDTFVFLPNRNDYKLPYVFKADIMALYNHPHKVQFKREDFLNALNRIKVLSLSNVGSRLYVNFETDKMVLETKDDEYGKEVISAIVPPELQGFYIILSTKFLLDIASRLNGENLFLYAINSKDIPAVKIDDENKDIYFVHVAYEYLDRE